MFGQSFCCISESLGGNHHALVGSDISSHTDECFNSGNIEGSLVIFALDNYEDRIRPNVGSDTDVDLPICLRINSKDRIVGFDVGT